LEVLLSYRKEKEERCHDENLGYNVI